MKIFEPKAHFLYEIEKSKFIGYLFVTNSIEEFNQIYKHLKDEHKKATHICYGYKIKNNNEIKIKSNDDKEPKGTASIPIISAIEKNNLNNVCLFIVRYFGGTKLGVGGLYRSYTKVAFETIKLTN